MRLRIVTSAALHLQKYGIRYIDIIYLIVFGDGGFISFNLAKFCHFTARTVSEYRRAGAHCVSQHDILRGEFGNSSPLEFPRSRIDLKSYSIAIVWIIFLTEAVFDLWL